MRNLLTSLLLFVCILIPLGAPADDREPSASPAGDSQEKELQGSPDTMAPKTGTASAADGKPTIDGQPPKKTSAPVDKDRRWLIREPPPGSKKAMVAPAKPLTWSSQAQQERCRNDLGKLNETFLKARYYSVQGDSCACAEYAASFLDAYESTRKACPDNFLENEGYNARIFRNMAWLKALGDKRCMGPNVVSGAPPKTTDASIPEKPHPTAHEPTASSPTVNGDPPEAASPAPAGEPPPTSD